MPNPQLSPEQRVEANKILAEVRERISVLAAGSPELRFAYLRKIAKELIYDERGKPAKRRRLKRQIIKAQGGACASCGDKLPERGAVMDRKEAIAGYVRGNADVVCPGCDHKRQAAKGST